MKLGIYGCSFTTMHKHELTQHFAWYNLLARKLGGIVYNFELGEENKTYGRGAAPTFYSYNKFLENYHKHDINIFVISDPLKYTKLVTVNGVEHPISGVSNVEYFLSQTTDSHEINLLNAIKSWYLVSDEKFLYAVQELMIQHMEQLDNKIILIPAQKAWVSPDRWNKLFMHFGLWDLAHRQNEILEIPKSYKHGLVEKVDRIAGHFTEETNTFLADKLFDYITNKTKIKLPKNIPHRYSWDYYFDC